MKIYLIIIMFILIGALFIVGENNLALRYPENRAKFSQLYISWIGQTFENTGNLVGYVVKLDWLPKEG